MREIDVPVTHAPADAVAVSYTHLLLDRHAGVRDFDLGMLPGFLFGFAQQGPAVLLLSLIHI